MSFAYLGGRTIGECVPLAVTAKGALDVAIGASLPEVQAKLAGAVQAQANIALNPPTLATQLNAALALVAQLQAMIALGVPGGVVDLTAMAKVIAELQATIGLLNTQVDFSASFSATLGASGVHAYLWEGKSSDAVPGGLPGLPADADSWGLFLVTGSAATWSSMQAMFSTS